MVEQKYSPQLTQEVQPITPLQIPRDRRGKIIWSLEENTVEMNLQLAVTNLRTLFLNRYPEFDRLFPRGEDDKIVDDKRDEARKFIVGQIGTRAKFRQQFGVTPITSVPVFKRSIAVVLTQTFGPWGIDFDPPQEWISIKSLAEEKGKNVEDIRTVANRFRQDFPEGFEFYRSNKKLMQFYSAEIALLINQEISDNELHSGTWITEKRVAYKFKRPLKAIKEIAGRLSRDHPDWLKTIKQQGGLRTYYSQRLEGAIEKELEQIGRGLISPEEANKYLRGLVEG